MEHNLIGTGTTSRKISSECGLQVEALQSGPFGGDQQIGARITEGNCQMLVFFYDPLHAMAHADDVKALLRIATLHNILMATNVSTADMIMASSDFGKELDVELPNADEYIYNPDRDCPINKDMFENNGLSV